MTIPSRTLFFVAGVLLLLKIDLLAVDELWTRGLPGSPSSVRFQPFNVIIIESIVGNHLVGICSYANYTDGKELPSKITIKGVKTTHGRFCPHVIAKVAYDVNAEWTAIGELGNNGKASRRTIRGNSIDDNFTVSLDLFRPYIGKFVYGSLVLPSGEAAVFELKDLLPPEPAPSPKSAITPAKQD